MDLVLGIYLIIRFLFACMIPCWFALSLFLFCCLPTRCKRGSLTYLLSGIQIIIMMVYLQSDCTWIRIYTYIIYNVIYIGVYCWFLSTSFQTEVLPAISLHPSFTHFNLQPHRRRKSHGRNSCSETIQVDTFPKQWFFRKVFLFYTWKTLENLVYHFYRQLWLVLGVKLMEINSNVFSR